MAKIAIILHAEPRTHDSMSRVMHSLVYAKELKEAGHDVWLIFDGGGTAWIPEMNNAENVLNPLFKEVMEKGIVAGACDFCMGKFDVDKQKVQDAGVSALSEYMGHPSVSKLIGEGYQIIIL